MPLPVYFISHKKKYSKTATRRTKSKNHICTTFGMKKKNSERKKRNQAYAKRFHILSSNSSRSGSNSLLHNNLFFGFWGLKLPPKYGSKQLFVCNCQTWKSILLRRFVPNQNMAVPIRPPPILIVKSIYIVAFLGAIDGWTHKSSEDESTKPIRKWNRMCVCDRYDFPF